MAAIVEISAVETTIHCDEEGKAEQKITIHNTSGRELRLGARVRIDSPGKSEWVGTIVQSDRKKATEWELGANDTIQLTVPIKAEGAPEGQYGFRVEVYSTEAPGEDFVVGDTLAFKVLAKKVEPAKEAKKKFPMWIIAVIVGVLVVGGGITVWLVAGGDNKTPDLVGMSLDKAKVTLVDHNFELGTVTERLTGNQPTGTVLSQKPEANAEAEKNSKVELVVEAGSISVPKLISMSLAVAKSTLEDEGLKLGTVTEQSAGNASAGTVLGQTPEAKTKVAKDSAVDLVVAAAATPSVARTLPMVYEHYYYGGRSQTLDVGRYDIGQLSIGNDIISSAKVPPGWRVTLYQHAGFQGATKVLMADTSTLPDFNDLTSSIVVENLPTVYEHYDYGGRSQMLSAGRYDMGQLSIGNDIISSVAVPPGWRVTLYQHAGFQGATKVLTADTPALPDFNDVTSSIVVEQR